MKYFLLIIAISLLISCGDSKILMAIEAPTVSACMQAIEKRTKSKLKIISDKPEKVLGKLSNGNMFWCKRVSTGTKGTFYEGVWEENKD